MLGQTNLAYSDTNSSSITPACERQIDHEATIDANNATAISFAENSNEYKSIIREGYTPTLQPTVGAMSQVNYTTCSAKMTVIVAFGLKDPKGYLDSLQVLLDSSLTKVISATVRDAGCYGCPVFRSAKTVVPEFPMVKIALLAGIIGMIVVTKKKS